MDKKQNETKGNDDIKSLLIETFIHGRLFNIQSLKFSEPTLFCLVIYRVVYMMCICKTFFRSDEVILSPSERYMQTAKKGSFL